MMVIRRIPIAIEVLSRKHCATELLSRYFEERFARKLWLFSHYQ